MSATVLALDTTTEVTAVAVGSRDEDQTVTVLTSCDAEAPRAAMSRVLPCVADLVAALGLSARDIDEVVVGRGPGSFTGVRIGVATAKGIAHGLDAPLFGVGTLDAIAWRIARDLDADGSPILGVLGDAMRGEVYPARFRIRGGNVERLEPDTVAKPRWVAETWAEEGAPLLLAGNGLHKHREVFESVMGELASFAPVGLWSPSGAALLDAYAGAWRTGDVGSGDPGALLPIYTRLSDAEEAEHDRARATGGGEGERSGSTPQSGVRGPVGSEGVERPKEAR